MFPCVDACCCPMAGSHWSECRAHLLARMISCRCAQFVHSCCSTAASRRHLCLLGGKCCSIVHLSHLQEQPGCGEHLQVLMPAQAERLQGGYLLCNSEGLVFGWHLSCLPASLCRCCSLELNPNRSGDLLCTRRPRSCLVLPFAGLLLQCIRAWSHDGCELSYDLRSLSDTTAYHYSQPSSPQGNASYLAWDCGIGRISPLLKAEVSLRPLRKYKSGLSASRPHGRRSTATRTGEEASQRRQDLLASCDAQGATLQWSQVNSAHAPALLWELLSTVPRCSAPAQPDDSQFTRSMQARSSGMDTKEFFTEYGEAHRYCTGN